MIFTPFALALLGLTAPQTDAQSRLDTAQRGSSRGNAIEHELLAPTPLQFTRASRDYVVLDMEIEATAQSFTLERLQVRTDDYQLFRAEGDQLIPIQSGPAEFYRGTTPDGRYRASFGWDGTRALGTVRDLYTGDVLDYCTEDAGMEAARTLRKPSRRPQQAPPLPQYAGLAEPPVARLDFVADMDYEGYVFVGESLELAELHLLSVVGTMNDEHWNDPLETDDPRIEIQIPLAVIRTTPDGPYGSFSLSETLMDATDEWSGPLGFLPRDVVHVFSGRDMTLGIFGIAWIAGICNELGIAIVEQMFPTLLDLAAEHTYLLGINWGLQDCGPFFPDCDLMCQNDACGNDNTGFAAAVLDFIASKYPEYTCVDSFVAGTATQAPNVSEVLVDNVPAVVPGGAPSTLIGSGFEGVDAISVGGVDLDPLKGEFTVQDDSTILLAIPELPALGPQTVVISNALGSDSATIQVATNTTPALELVDSTPGVLDSQGSAEIFVGAQPGDLVLLYASDSLIPSTLPGVVELGLGNGFTQLADLGIFVVDGTTGYVHFTAPLSLVQTLTELYVQAVVLSPSLALPAAVTNVETGIVY